eukprot:COSAG02_NODE_37311_length_443_cov_1.337209_2_plen_112_part_01
MLSAVGFNDDKFVPSSFSSLTDSRKSKLADRGSSDAVVIFGTGDPALTIIGRDDSSAAAVAWRGSSIADDTDKDDDGDGFAAGRAGTCGEEVSVLSSTIRISGEPTVLSCND